MCFIKMKDSFLSDNVDNLLHDDPLKVSYLVQPNTVYVKLHT